MNLHNRLIVETTPLNRLSNGIAKSKDLNPPEKQKKFDTFTVSNLIYYNGGPLGTRTPDPLIKSQLLYQLS